VTVGSTTEPAPNPRDSSATSNDKLAAFLALVATVVVLNYLGEYAVKSNKKDTEEALFHYSTAVGAAIIYGLILVFVLWIAGWRPYRPGRKLLAPEQRNLLALRKPRSWARSLGLALVTLIVAGIVISLVDQSLHGGREQGVVPPHWLPGHTGAYVVNWIVVAAVAPFVEETTYRGLGFALFDARWGPWPAILGTGILFALSHGLLQALPELAIFGFALAWLRSRTESVFPGMLVHSAFNSFALATVFWH
jgi:membrane protease YdiL (CAAX protease family)